MIHEYLDDAASKKKEEEANAKKKGSRRKKLDIVKFVNIDSNAYGALCQSNPLLRTGIIDAERPTLNEHTKHVLFSLKALSNKGIWTYLKNIP